MTLLSFEIKFPNSIRMQYIETLYYYVIQFTLILHFYTQQSTVFINCENGVSQIILNI